MDFLLEVAEPRSNYMGNITKRLSTRYLAVVVVIGAALVLGWSFVDRGESAIISLEGISEQDLAARDLKLEPLRPGQATSISRRTAEEAVAERFPKVAVRDAVLSRLTKPIRGVDTAVWAINLEPQDKDLNLGKVPASAVEWLVVFIDANTGAFIQASWGGHAKIDDLPSGGLPLEFYPTPPSPRPLSLPAAIGQ